MRALVRELFKTIILSILVFMAMHISVQNYRVQGPSMQPTLVQGEYVIVNKLVYAFQPPQLGEVVVFQFPEDRSRDLVKRVIGVPGDTVSMKNGLVILNNAVLEEPYVTQGDSTTMPPITLGAGEFFVLGDNRQASNDSRNWGAVTFEDLIGRAWLKFWPVDKLNILSTALFWD